jgi:hypothetical protein
MLGCVLNMRLVRSLKLYLFEELGVGWMFLEEVVGWKLEIHTSWRRGRVDSIFVKVGSVGSLKIIPVRGTGGLTGCFVNVGSVGSFENHICSRRRRVGRMFLKMGSVRVSQMVFSSRHCLLLASLRKRT